jgi:hypothetical protein
MLRAYRSSFRKQTVNGSNLIHHRATQPSAPAVVIRHGLLDLLLRFEKVLPLMTVHVVVRTVRS